MSSHASIKESAPRVLVVDDDRLSLRGVCRNLTQMGCAVTGASDAQEAFEYATAESFDVCLLDQHLPDGSTGVELMQQIHKHDPAVRCIIFTGDGDPGLAYSALDLGALEYFEKPIRDWGRLNRMLLEGTRARRAEQQGGSTVSRQSVRNLVEQRIVGVSPHMERVRWQVERLAKKDVTVMLRGDTGVGKTLIAEAIHEASDRTGECILINCATLSKETMVSELFGHEEGAFTGASKRHLGAFERAAGGTLILDEIGELDEVAQRKLLHALDDGHFTRMGGVSRIETKARVVAATNRDLEVAVAKGEFRSDLLNRLGIVVWVPGLNERREDIPRLAYLFLDQLNTKWRINIRSIPRDVMERLERHDWGSSNLRGLKTVISQAAIYASGDSLQLADFPEDFLRGSSAQPLTHLPNHEAPTGLERLPREYQGLSYGEFKDQVLSRFTRLYLLHRLRESGGNVTRAAETAELHRPNFKRLMTKFGVTLDDL